MAQRTTREENAPAVVVSRKADHVRITLKEDVAGKGVTTGFECYRFIYNALPETDLNAVDVSLELFGWRLRAPLLISSMTGGFERVGEINRRLAAVAQSTGIAMGVGSQLVALEAADAASTFAIRDVAPDILLFANLGAVQLNHGFGVDECRRAVEMISADALILHLNPLQEALQPEGNTNFAGLVRKIEVVCRTVGVPVVVKEVGWGISAGVAQTLREAGVVAIDVAGAGGTSWSEVEKHRATSRRLARVAGKFAGWGTPTAESLVAVKAAVGDVPVFASGGVRDGLTAAKALALGATLVGVANAALRAAATSEGAALELVEEMIEIVRIAMFATGCVDLATFAARCPLTETAR